MRRRLRVVIDAICALLIIVVGGLAINAGSSSTTWPGALDLIRQYPWWTIFAVSVVLIGTEIAVRLGKKEDGGAAERLVGRATDYFANALDQLGSDKTIVRLSGVNTLERVGQANPQYRQDVVEALCAYLRQPTPDEYRSKEQAPLKAADRDRPLLDASGEREVRIAAQRVIARHLRTHRIPRGLDRELLKNYPGVRMILAARDMRDPQTGRPWEAEDYFQFAGKFTRSHSDRKDLRTTFWKDIDLDLTGATLIDLDFTNIRIRSARFVRARFIGDAEFNGAEFISDARFEEANFTGSALFESSMFHEAADFHNARVGGNALFARATFHGPALFECLVTAGIGIFSESRFWGKIDLARAEFSSDFFLVGSIVYSYAYFTDARFLGRSFFQGTTFAALSQFDGAHFLSTQFVRTRFMGAVSFADLWGNGKVEFAGEVDYKETLFAKKVDFSNAALKGAARFLNATFEDGALFNHTAFGEDVRFEGAIFDKSGIPMFRQVTFAGDVDFCDTSFHRGVALWQSEFRGRTAFEKVLFGEGALFSDSRFAGDLKFGECEFPNGARFARAAFGGTVAFVDSSFGARPDFEGASVTRLKCAEDNEWPPGWSAQEGSTAGAGVLVWSDLRPT